jgi:hypothetical protein
VYHYGQDKDVTADISRNDKKIAASDESLPIKPPQFQGHTISASFGVTI